MRLNSYIAQTGQASRRAADELIKAGRVTVNGRPGRLNDDIGVSDKVAVDGVNIKTQKQRYILLNKPAGYITTVDDPQGRPKVIDLIDVKERLVPVGRLDYDTTGLLLLTNDGQLAHKLMHPRFGVDKTYQAEVKGRIDPKILNMLSNGVRLDDGITAPANAKRLADNKLELTIHEGRKHQVKRMLAAVGLTVTGLHRSRYGPLGLGSLDEGAWRELAPTEVESLRFASEVGQSGGKSKKP